MLNDKLFFPFKYAEIIYECHWCSEHFLMRPFSNYDFGFIVYVTQCHKCSRLALLNMDKYPYKPIREYFYEKVVNTKEYEDHFSGADIEPFHPDSQKFIRSRLDHENLYKTVEMMIESCSCGGTFVIDRTICPQCYHQILGGYKREDRIDIITRKDNIYLAPIRPLEDIPKLNSPLLEDIFRDAEGPKTTEEVKEQLRTFSKKVKYMSDLFGKSNNKD